jgi:hypothetical protein
MITVIQDSTNKIMLDVSTVIASPYFLIQFKNPYDCVTFTALFQNQNSDCSYYLIWIVEVGEGGVEDRVNGEIRLSPSGMYEIKIYAQASSSNLDIANATFIENNLLTVINEEVC